MAVKSSGISTQHRSTTPAPATPSEEEAYRMPLEQLRELANKQLREQTQ
jgi:hypothetical protein